MRLSTGLVDILLLQEVDKHLTNNLKYFRVIAVVIFAQKAFQLTKRLKLLLSECFL